MNGLVQMLEMAGNTIQEQNRIIEGQQQEIVRLRELVSPPPAGTIDDPLPTPPMTPTQTMNC